MNISIHYVQLDVSSVVDLHIDQVSDKSSLMAVSESQMSGKGCTVREGLRTLVDFFFGNEK